MYFIGKNIDKQVQVFLGLIESFYADQFVNEYSPDK